MFGRWRHAVQVLVDSFLATADDDDVLSLMVLMAVYPLLI